MNILIQRINIANNENRRNKLINAIFSFFEINIIICFIIYIIKQNNKLNIWMQHPRNKNKNMNDHRFLDINNNISINRFYIGTLLNYINLTRDTELNDKLYSNYKNNSTFNFNEGEYLLAQLLDMSIYDYYDGRIDNLFYNKNNTNIDKKIKNSTLLKFISNIENKINIRLIKAKDIFNSQAFLVIDLNNYISNIRYILYANISKLNNINDIINKRFIIKGLFSGILFDGQINNKINLSAFAELKFKTESFLSESYSNKTQNISHINPSRFTLLLLISDYGLNLKINSTIEILQNAHQIKFYKIYDKNELRITIFIIIFLITNTIGVRCLIRNIKRKEYLISAISLESFTPNFICHYYSSLIYIILFFFTYNKLGKLLYAIAALFSIINFIFYDYAFINLFWKLKRRRLTCFQSFKLRLRVFILNSSFIILFYLFSIRKAIMNFLFFYLSFMIWTPQILHNIINNNRYIYPFFYIFFSTFDKLFYLFLFNKMENHSFRNINKFIIIISILYILSSIIILYLQTFLGPRFMLPSICYKKEISIYISNKELLNDKSKSKLHNEICIICLAKILDIAKKKEKNDNNKTNDENKNNITTNTDNQIETNIDNNNSITTSRIDLVSSENNQPVSNNISNASPSLRVIRYSIKLFIKTLKNIGFNLKDILSDGLFSFYIKRGNLKNKEIMILPCGHIYHSICLNEWLERKRICPICSKSIPEI